MSKAQRRKDVVAAVVIIGTAILYWTSGNRAVPTVEEHRERGTTNRPSVQTDLPGLRIPGE